MDINNENINEEELNATQEVTIPEVLPLMAIRDVVVFSNMIIPLFVGRDVSVEAVNEALTKDKLLFLVTQKDATQEKPDADDLYRVGMVSIIMRTLKLPDGRVKILVNALSRASIVEILQKEPFYTARIKLIEENAEVEVSVEVEALMRTVREQMEKLMSLRGAISSDFVMVMQATDDPGRLADLVSSNLRLKITESQEILETMDSVERLKRVAEIMNKELEVSAVQAKIKSDAKEEMNRSQREYYLREQMHALKRELGETDDRSQEIEEIREKFTKMRMPPPAKKEALKQLKRLEMMHPDASESAMLRTYIDWLLEVPWNRQSKDNLDLKVARKVLDADHFGLEKVKERILEYLAVRSLKRDSKGPILCFVGPPGVGKTSLGQSIARAMGRKFHRLSLGGMRDEAEIRGHRRTYIGAMPGRVIQGLKTVGTRNPIFMLDEIDKVGADYRGDPSSALLEVLDPEQNNSFSDHYLNLPFDLSRVMFITTANMTDTIPSALLDRMEVIRLSGYTQEEKMEIARKYLLPRQIKENGLAAGQLKIEDKALLRMISHYTHEAGLRNLERELGKVCRKVARRVAEGKKSAVVVDREKALPAFLGPPKYLPEDESLVVDQPGLAVGLAWTEVGGELLHIEVNLMKGKGNLTLTGQLGEVMKESAQAALSFCRTRQKELGVDDAFFEDTDIHIHVPAGAIPKDGPSAGVTMATALFSAISGRQVKSSFAMTGEVTLRGRVLPIGGLKEKTLAAVRAGLRQIIIPEENLKDLEEIPKDIRKTLHFHPVRHMDQILALVFDAPPRTRKAGTKKDGGKDAAAKGKAARKKAVRPAAPAAGGR